MKIESSHVFKKLKSSIVCNALLLRFLIFENAPWKLEVPCKEAWWRAAPQRRAAHHPFIALIITFIRYMGKVFIKGIPKTATENDLSLALTDYGALVDDIQVSNELSCI